MIAPFRIILVFSLLIPFAGCAFVDRTILRPSAEMARVPPLFRTSDCVGYIAPKGNAWWDWHNPFIKNSCEEQKLSIYTPPVTANGNPEGNTSTEALSSPTDNTSFSQICKPEVTGDDLKECAAFLMRMSDEICNVHLSKIFGDRAVTNVTLGILAAGAGIAGGIVPGLVAANALSGASGFLTGTRSLLNEEVYRNYVAEAIIKEIKGNRDRLAIDIQNGIIGKAPKDNQLVGVEQVALKVSRYHNECSFYAGLSSLLGKAGLPKESFAPNLKDSLNQQILNLQQTRENTKDPNQKLNYQKQIDILQSVLANLNPGH